MGQRHRYDGPGVRHHFMNRGIAKRLVFAGRRDRRQFLSELARAFRRGQLQVEAYSLMGTHFHMIVRTEHGTLSEGMRRVQNGFSRWFNRRNRRDGPLVRARFRSRPIRSRAHLFAALPYVDFNPVKARLCRTPGEYEGPVDGGVGRAQRNHAQHDHQHRRGRGTGCPPYAAAGCAVSPDPVPLPRSIDLGGRRWRTARRWKLDR